FDQPLAYLYETVAHRGVVDLVADLDDEAADEVGVGRDLEDRGPRDDPFELLPQGLRLGVVERGGDADLHRDQAAAAVPLAAGLLGDVGREAEPAVAVEDAEEAEDDVGGLPLQER